MVDAISNKTLDLANGQSSSQQSGVSSPLPLQVGVPPTERADDLFLAAAGTQNAPHINSDTTFFKAEGGAEHDDSDIYRGERPPSPVNRVLDLDGASVAPSTSSSSSSSSLNVGRRFGALASAVEAALSRWARAHSSAASNASSSSSSVSSVSTTNRTHTTRRKKGKRYSSSASVYNAVREREILARKKAQEEFRIVPREFTLLLPSDSIPGHRSPTDKTREQERERRTIRTSSLQLILDQLDAALKQAAKSRRAHERSAAFEVPSSRSSHIGNKGKGKKTAVGEASRMPKTSPAPASAKGGTHRQKSWWLDVASPSWDDLSSIGKLLHLHPLTLEDILHRDPREKLESFPGLGYYFIVFRALESERSRERLRKFRIQDGEGSTILPSSSADEGVVGAVNVYMVVFAEGICSFHFEDISEHTDKLRNKVLKLDNTFDMTSDWIAHGLMDSIVDSFFPILASIEKEIKDVDSLVLEGSSPPNKPEPTKAETTTIESTNSTSSSMDSTTKTSEPLSTSSNEKVDYPGKEGPRFAPLNIRISEAHFSFLRNIGRAIRRLLRRRKAKKATKYGESVSSTTKTLLKMAAVRRIVTSLGRLLGTKGEVIAQIRKRLILASREISDKGSGSHSPSDNEVAIYMGDIQDHIITLQQSLSHYERMLSHSHPAYLSQLRVSQSLTKGSTDKSILILTTVSITVVSIQVPLGLFSMNVGKIPNNKAPSDSHPFAIFFSVMGFCVFVGINVVSLVLYWRVRAKKRYSRKVY